MLCMALDPAQLPDEIATLKAMLIAADKRAGDRDAEIENLKLTIAKMRRDKYGSSSERGTKLLDQLELQLTELEASVAQDRIAAELALPSSENDVTKQKPARRPLPDHLPRERVVHVAPCVCNGCGGRRLRKLGEDITETLAYGPARWKVIQHVRERSSPAGIVRRSRRHRRPTIRSHAAGLIPLSSPRSCSTSTAPTCRSIGSAISMPMRASTWMSQRWPTGSVPAPQP